MNSIEDLKNLYQLRRLQLIASLATPSRFFGCVPQAKSAIKMAAELLEIAVQIKDADSENTPII